MMAARYTRTPQDLSATLLRLGRAHRRADVSRLLVQRLSAAPGVEVAAAALTPGRGRTPEVIWLDPDQQSGSDEVADGPSVKP